MITIRQIREKYPDYNDLSDEQLVNSLYNKHYSDMPKNDFYAKIGFNSGAKQDTEKTGFAGIGEDIIDSFANLPQAAVSTLLSLPGEAMGAVKHPLRSLENIGVGLGEGVIGAFNAPGNLTKYLAAKGLFPETLAKYAPHIGDLGIEKKLGLDVPQPGDALVRGLASFAVPGKLGKFGEAGALKRAGIVGAHALGQEENPLQAALLSEFLPKIAEGATKLKPSKLFRGKLSPKQLKENLQSVKGTNTGLGRVIESPTLMKLYENVLPNLIGTGAEKTMQRTAKQVQEKTNNLIKKISGGIHHSEAPVKLHEALKKAYRDVTNEKNKKFELVNKIADEQEIKTKRTNLRKSSKELLGEINSDPDLSKFTAPEDIKLISDIAKGGKKEYSLKNTDILRGKIGQLAYEASSKGEMPKKDLYGKLKTSLEKDVTEAVNSSDHPGLKQAHKEAMDYYRSNYAPFKDKNIQKFTIGSGDPDLLLNTFLKTGQTDRANLFESFRKLMPKQKEGSNMLEYSYLSKAFDEGGNINPVKLSTLYHKLGHNQKKVLFQDKKVHKKLKDIVNLIDKNKEAFNLMFNPKTGSRTGQVAEAVSTLTALGSGAGLGAINPIILGALFGRGATHLLTSPKYREKLVNAMIKGKSDKGIPKTKSALRKIGAISPLELNLDTGAAYAPRDQL